MTASLSRSVDDRKLLSREDLDALRATPKKDSLELRNVSVNLVE